MLNSLFKGMKWKMVNAMGQRGELTLIHFSSKNVTEPQGPLLVHMYNLNQNRGQSFKIFCISIKAVICNHPMAYL